MGRGARRRRAHRPAAPAARARHHLAGDGPHPVAGLVRRGGAGVRRAARALAGSSWSAGSRWAARWRCGWPSSTAAAGRRRRPGAGEPGGAAGGRAAGGGAGAALGGPLVPAGRQRHQEARRIEDAYDRIPPHALHSMLAVYRTGGRPGERSTSRCCSSARRRTTSSRRPAARTILDRISSTDAEEVCWRTATTWRRWTTTPDDLRPVAGVRGAGRGRGPAVRDERHRPGARRRPATPNTRTSARARSWTSTPRSPRSSPAWADERRRPTWPGRAKTSSPAVGAARADDPTAERSDPPRAGRPANADGDEPRCRAPPVPSGRVSRWDGVRSTGRAAARADASSRRTRRRCRAAT